MTQTPYVYRYDGDDPLPPPAPDMELCAKVYRGARQHAPGIDRVALAAVGADNEAIGEVFLAGAAGLRQVGEAPPEVTASLKIVTEWVIGQLAGQPVPARAVQ